MQRSGSALFEGLPAAELEPRLSRLEHHRFPAGATVLAQGEINRGTVYVIESGSVDVCVTDREGEHWIARRGPGETLGEISFITGEPASATVRAATELKVLVLNEVDFMRLAGAFPQVHQNISEILAERLADTTRRLLAEPRGSITVLRDNGAPPVLGYALASSVAWHTRRPTVLVVVTGSSPPSDLAALATAVPGPERTDRLVTDASSDRIHTAREHPGPAGVAQAHLMLLTSAGGGTSRELDAILEEMSARYDYVLAQIVEETPPTWGTRATVRLAGPQTPLPEDAGAHPRCTLRAWTDTPELAHPDTEGVLRVPPLGATDEEALRRGALPPATPAGRVLGWAARDLAGLKVGLALGSGIRGYAHIGVLRVLQRAGITPDYIAGTSMGAVIGTALAAGFALDETEHHMTTLSGSLIRPTLPIFSVLSSARLREALRRLGGDRRIEDMRVPLAVVAADIITRREVVFRRGLAWQAVLASAALPGVFPPQRVGPYLLVDGAVLNPVPCRVASEMGADIVIGVRLDDPSATRDAPTEVADAEAAARSGRPPSILQVIMRSIEMMQSKITADTAATATLLIEPRFKDTPRPWFHRFSEGRPHIEVGEAAAEAALPRIASLLPWLRG